LSTIPRPGLLVIHCFLVVASQVALMAQEPVWRSEGPAPILFGQVENIVPDDEVAGAVHTVVAHPTNADILWIGSVNGGIWKTENATDPIPAWVRQTDSEDGSMRSLSIGAMSLDPTDATDRTLVAGIGGFSSFGARGDRIGVLRTTNGGDTWTLLPGAGLDGPNITGIAARGNVIVLSANNATVRGVYRSMDGGNTFSKLTLGGSGSGLPDGIYTDLVGDPVDPDRLYTVAWSSAPRNSVYRSDDTGETWTPISSPEMESLLASENISTIELAVGRANNIFVGICIGGRLAALYRSGDGGASWSALDLPSPSIHPGFQASLHFSIAADPTDPDIVYLGGDRQNLPFPNEIGATDYSGNLYRIDASLSRGSQAAHLTHSDSLGPSGGGTASSSSPHADSREMTFDADGNLIETNDGGIYKRTQPRSNQGDWFSINGDLTTTEIHSIAYDTHADIIMGGAQDNGSSSQNATADRIWSSISTADGGDVAVDDTSTPDVSIRYSSFQRLFGFRRQVWNADNELLASTQIALQAVSGEPISSVFVTPIELNGADMRRMVILAANGTYESFDQGDTVSQISQAATYQALSGSDPIAYGAFDNEDILYVASRNRMYVRTGPPPAPLVESAGFPDDPVGYRVRDIKLDRNKGNTAFVLNSANIFMTQDAGTGWASVLGNLLSFDPGFLLSLAFRSDPPTLFIGATRGVYRASADSGYTDWRVAGQGLPNALVYDLDYDDADDLLIAGLMGRGAWLLDVADRCPLDLNGDETVDATDFGLALAAWSSDLFDTNDNGFVDIIDLLEVTTGSCPTAKRGRR